jgi:YfiH family protein
LIRWKNTPGPYEVVFSTREGGVSEGPWASLNLGRMTDDEPERVEENRRLLCEEVAADPETLALNYQYHSADVLRARPGARDDRADGLWTDEPGLPVLALSADCLPIALARTNGSEPALAVLHAGWRGLLAGIAQAGVGALGGRPVAAIVGPGIGPCCYEVGPEVSARFDADLTTNGILDLWSAAERALRRAGVAHVDRVDQCTRCNPELFFSHRRSGAVRGVQGVLGAVAG